MSSILLEPSSAPTGRVATTRTVLMCRPDHFTVSYRINPWMHPQVPTDTALAVRQWEELYRIYRDLYPATRDQAHALARLQDAAGAGGRDDALPG